MRRLAILGASGHGKVVAEAAILCGFEVVEFFDDAWPDLKINAYWPVVGDTESLINTHQRYDGIIVGIGDNFLRQDKLSKLVSIDAKIVSIVHPRAIVSQFALVKLGTFIAAGAIVQVDARIGFGCIINTNAVVEHDCIIGDAVHVSPSVVLAGSVRVSDRTWIGVSSCVKHQVSIGHDVIVGAGSTVVGDIPSKLVVVGNPAKQLVK